MIPLKLELKNFLSYGETIQTIDFSQDNLICLSGKNGHGKSAILDAITWALWGQARKSTGVSKPDEGLLKVGKSKMLVVLHFSVDNNQYRIRREFMKTYSRPLASLELCLFNKENQTYIPITGKTIRDTQEKIIECVKLDFDTFINSSFFRQGNSNEFSKKNPRDRKLLLAKILGLDRFESMQKIALEQNKNIGNKISTLETLKEKNREQLQKQDWLTAEALKKKNTLKTLEMKYYKTLKLLKTSQEKLLEKEKYVIEIQSKQELQKNFCQQKSSNKEKYFKAAIEWKKLHSDLISVQNPNKIKEKLNLIKKEIEIEEERQSKIFANQKLLLEKKDILQKSIAYQEAKDKISSFKSSIVEQENLIKSLVEQNSELERQSLKFNKYQTFYQRLIAKETRLKRIGEESSAKLNTESKICPTCSQPISVETRKSLKEIVLQKNLINKHLLAKIEILKKKTKLNIEKKELALKALEQNRQRANAIKEKINFINNELDLYNQKLKNLTKIEADLDQLALEIATLKKITEDKFDSSSYQLLKKEQSDLEEKIMQSQHYQKTIPQQLSSIKNNRLELKAQFRYAQQKESLLNNEIQSLSTKLSELNPETKIKELEIQIKDVLDEASKIKESLGGIKGELQRLSEVQKEIKENERDLSHLKTEQEDYQIIAETFGKNGIQALLIEESIPQIEDEANRILDLISQTQAKVFIESLKNLKSGTTKESLDIKISDTSGLRPYEMFSGGEAFRIDFALRVAISKIVAKKAGATMKTLIIDEGFGSLDEEGVSLLMNCIYGICNDFEKIIIVSHLPNLKEMFPVHVNVVKNIQGSKVSIERRG